MKEIPGVMKIKDEVDYLGFIQFPTLVMYDQRLSPAQRILYCILRRYARQEDCCFPGVKRLAKALGMSQRSVQGHIGALEEHGLITRHFRTGRSTIYEFERLDEVYAGDDRQLTDDVIEMLRAVGEDHVANAIVNRRAGIEPGDERGEPEEPEVESEEVETKSNAPRWEDVQGKIAENQAKSDAFTERRKQNQKKVAQDPTREKARVSSGVDEDDGPRLTVNDVELEFRAAAKEAWPDVPAACAPWDVKHKSIAKHLCERFGHELTIQVLGTVVRNWDEYVNRFDLNGYPNVKLVASFADSWFPEIQAGVSIDPLPKRARVRKEREYDEATGTDGGGVTFIGD
jgi:DNA-binding transcriptional ArsR family regulator